MQNAKVKNVVLVRDSIKHTRCNRWIASLLRGKFGQSMF